MSKFVNANGNELNKDVLLWSGSHTGYSHDLTLSDDALKFKELIILSDNSAVIAPVIDGQILFSGVVNNWTVTNMAFKYTQATKLLHIDNCRWTNSSNNSSTTVTKVYGRY
ncbi:hypothetical protein [Coprobacillus sp. AF33-1AC]|uniref:hypothetical protein n=1 Tax=Coprobacillus sp. AF33-1AC TaxID=2292032 RepID=UPI000E495F36|nr:hypothetical protein [Coprobacillus sp. AF33-1AC]RHM59644.1 hypothetical protein DWZ53_08855 [Coprobacillus sp. AF33-1AC]